jgi:Bacterial extracellular solute-binding protein
MREQTTQCSKRQGFPVALEEPTSQWAVSVECAYAHDVSLIAGRLRAASVSISTIWPQRQTGQPDFASGIPLQDRDILNSYMVGRKLVAMPYHPNVHVLLYRTDLLARYGYKTPPRTWDELEKMAVRIQAGERAKREQEFLGVRLVGSHHNGQRTADV